MRRIVLAAAATLALLVAGSFVPNRAEAMTVTTPSGLMAAIDGTNLAENIAYVCRRVWRCGPYGCGMAPRLLVDGWRPLLLRRRLLLRAPVLPPALLVVI